VEGLVELVEGMGMLGCISLGNGDICTYKDYGGGRDAGRWGGLCHVKFSMFRPVVRMVHQWHAVHGFWRFACARLEQHNDPEGLDVHCVNQPNLHLLIVSEEEEIRT
jgi:hypothetical protein